MSDERRRQGRVQAYIEVLWEGASGKYEARTGDIHTGGCFIDSIGEVGVVGQSSVVELMAGDILAVSLLAVEFNRCCAEVKRLRSAPRGERRTAAGRAEVGEAFR